MSHIMVYEFAVHLSSIKVRNRLIKTRVVNDLILERKRVGERFDK